MSARPSTFALTRPGPLRLYNTAELLRMPPPQWLVAPIMPVGGLVGLYGPPGVGKSFMAIDMALSVASGRPWQEHETQTGLVLYVAAEGSMGLTKRVAAWLAAHAISPSRVVAAWLTVGIPVSANSDEMGILMDRIAGELETVPLLIVIDTLARCFDGDENQQEDMGRFIGGVDRLRREYNSTVMVVHHTRLDGERERGNTAFRGAADTMIALDRPRHNTIKMTCNKQKDAAEFPLLNFQLQLVPDVNSCVIVPAGTDGRVAKELYILRTEGPLSWEDWRIRLGTAKATFSRDVVELAKTGQIAREFGKWRVLVP